MGYFERTDKDNTNSDNVILFYSGWSVFYSEKYFKAYPMLLENISTPTYSTKEDYAGHCYSLRTFDRFFHYFGLARIEQGKGMDAEKFILKSGFFNKLFEFLPHKVC